MAEDLYTAALGILFWCGLFFIAGMLAITTAVLYRIVADRVEAIVRKRAAR